MLDTLLGVVKHPHAHGDRPGSGDHPLALDPQLSGEPHTPRTPADPHEAAEVQLKLPAEDAARRIRSVAARSANVIREGG